MSRMRVAAALAGVIAAALLPAAGVLVGLAASPEWYRPRDDPISAFERRYTTLREALRGAAVVGYLAPVSEQSTARTAHLYTTRYALAPVQVLDDIDQPLVVADGMTDPSRVPPHLTVRRDFGGGLLLLERVPR